MIEVKCPKCDTLLILDGKIIRDIHTPDQCRRIRAFDRAIDRAFKEYL
jgi:phage FluMu protein Com